MDVCKVQLLSSPKAQKLLPNDQVKVAQLADITPHAHGLDHEKQADNQGSTIFVITISI